MDTKRNSTSKRLATLCIAALCLTSIAVEAQVNPRTYYQLGWQFDFPVNSGFTDRMNDLGLYLDAGYYFTPHVSLGGFINVNTRSEYIPRRTFTAGTLAVTTDQVRSYIQVPFGASLRYRFLWKTRWQPYVSAKVGMNYTEAESSQQLYAYSDKSWGFYVSPEIGINLYPFRHKALGFNIAAYYAYATNRHDVFYGQVDGMNCLGIRLGLAF